MEEILERLQKLEQENKCLKERIDYLENHVGNYPKLQDFCNSLQKWLEEDYVDIFLKDFTKKEIENFAQEIRNWIVEEIENFAQEIQNWIVEEYSPEVQDWVIGPFAESLQDWIDDYVTERLNGEFSFREKREHDGEADNLGLQSLSRFTKNNL